MDALGIIDKYYPEDNELKRIPYMLIVGEKEAENNQVSIRKQGEGDMGVLSVQDFATKVKEEVEAMMTVC